MWPMTGVRAFLQESNVESIMLCQPAWPISDTETSNLARLTYIIGMPFEV